MVAQTETPFPLLYGHVGKASCAATAMGHVGTASCAATAMGSGRGQPAAQLSLHDDVQQPVRHVDHTHDLLAIDVLRYGGARHGARAGVVLLGIER